MKIQKIVLIGTGNVGHHLGRHLVAEGLELVQVFSRKIGKARKLARAIGAEGIQHWDKLTNTADLYILAVSDHSIQEVAAQLPSTVAQQKLIVHTSGATPSTVLKPYCQRYGVFYPLQTFSIDRPTNFFEIPIGVHAKRKSDRLALQQLALRWTPKVSLMDDKQRAVLHVAAVFVNNFTNHLFQIGESICLKEGLSFDLLLPLIRETAEKVQQHSPAKMQTGPAFRGDTNTMERHLEYLDNDPPLAEIYRLLSESINPKLRGDKMLNKNSSLK